MDGLQESDMSVTAINDENGLREFTLPKIRQREPEFVEMKSLSAAEYGKVVERLKNIKTDEVLVALNEKFVYAEDVSRILARAIRTGKNVILWGPPGHAKSAMVMTALNQLGIRDSAYILDFGEGMDEPTLWGGLNFKKLHDDHILDFNAERSFLNYPVVVFEELFDAPPQVLCALKNTLTSKSLFKSADPFPMKTKVIIACTNKSPAEIAALGESQRALVERFPLQLEVKWPDYSSKSYEQLFEKIGFKDPMFNSVFAEIMAKAGKAGKPIAPRSAVDAYHVVKDSTVERCLSQPDERALSDLAYIPGLEEVGKKKSAEFAERMIKEEATRLLEAAQKAVEEVRENTAYETDPHKLLQSVADLANEEEEVGNFSCPKGLADDQKRVLTDLQRLSQELSQRAIQFTAKLRDKTSKVTA
jgi:hypothetical protein